MPFGKLGAGGRLGSLGGARAQNPLFHAGYTVKLIPASSTYYSFPARLRPNEPFRTQLVVRNLGSTILELAYGSQLNNNYNSPSPFTVVATLNPGQEYVENGASTSMIFLRPHTSGQGGRYTVYHEMNGAAQSGVSATIQMTPTPVGIPLLNLVSFATSGSQPVGISADRNTVYGKDNSTGGLTQSVNGASSWSAVNTFADPVEGIIETVDGEALVYTIGAGARPGKVYKSSGWAASHTGATWSLVLTSASTAYYRNYWNNLSAGPIIPIAEYGGLYTGPLDPTQATHYQVSNDNGATFAAALDIQVFPPAGTPMHSKGSIYDPYRGWIWGTYDTLNDNTHQALVYSTAAPWTTWTQALRPAEWQFDLSGLANWQSNPAIATKERVIFGSDHIDGYYIQPFTGSSNTVLGTPFVGLIVGEHSPAQMTNQALWRGSASSQMFGSVAGLSGNAITPDLIHADASNDAQTFVEMWRDETQIGNGNGIADVYQTSAGLLIGNVVNSTVNAGSPAVLRANVVQGVQGQYDGYANFTGDGSTKVFVQPHFLSSVPAIANCLGQNAASIANTPVVTVDAVNITLTFASAPTNALAYSYGLRYTGDNSGPAFSLAYTDGKQNTVGGNAITYASASIGAADANRVVAVAIMSRGGTSVSSVTIGGISATQVAGAAAAPTNLVTDIWYAVVPTGTTADVVVNYGSATVVSGIGVYRIITANPAPWDGQHNSGAAVGSGSPLTKSVNDPGSGGMVGVFGFIPAANGLTFTWSGGSAVSDQSVNLGTTGRYIVTAHDVGPSGATSYTVTPSAAGTSTGALSLATWRR